MKRILPLLILVLIGTLRAWSQEQVLFNLIFVSNAPPHAAFLPPGGGVLENNSFSAIVYLDNTAPTSGQLLELQNDNSFQAISPMNIVFAAYPPSMGGGGTAYDLEVTFLPVNSLQIQNLLAGKWYAEVVLDQNTYLGQFVMIPEASSAALLICGASLLLARGRFRKGRLT
jgi:hypothetical protein